MGRMAPVARHSATPPRGALARVLSVTAIALAVLLVSGASLAAIVGWNLAQRVTANAVDIGGEPVAAAPGLGEFEGPFTVLIVGADNAEDQGDRYGERDGATLNDVNLLLHVSADHTSGVAVSIPRDLVIRHPECTDDQGNTYPAMSARPVNEAFSRGGLPCVTETVRQLTGLEIGFAGLVSFDAVIEMTSAIGGVEVCLDAPLRDPNVFSPIDGSVLELPAGRYDIEGDEALGFLRSRYGVGDGSDLGRISSQQQFLSSMVRKIKSDETLTNLPRLFSLADVVSREVKLSTSLTNPQRMVSLAQALRTVDLDKLVFVQYPSEYNRSNPNKLDPVENKADELFALIAADQPFALGEDSKGAGVVATPAPADPTSPTASASPTPAPSAAAGPPVLDGVPGQTAQDETCAAVRD